MEVFGFILSLFAGFLPLGLILFVVVAVIGTRGEEDPDHARPAALYYNGVLLVTIFVVLFAAFAVVSSLLNLTLDKAPDDFFSSSGGEHDGDWDAAVRALLAGAVAAGLYQVHDARRRARSWAVVGERVRRTADYTVSFVAILVAAVAGVMALWSLWETIAPGVTGSGPRSEGLIGFISSGFLAASASFLASLHLREAEPDAPLRPAAPSAVTPPPPPPPPTTKKAAPAKKAAAKKAAKRA